MSYYTERECDICKRKERVTGAGYYAVEYLSAITQNWREAVDPNGHSYTDTISLCEACCTMQGMQKYIAQLAQQDQIE